MDQQITIGSEQLRDQREKMVEEYGVAEEEAEEIFKNVKTSVSLQAQEMGKGWSKETLEEVTNLVVAIQNQSYQNQQRRKAHFYDRLFRFLTSTLMATLVGFAVYLIFSGTYYLAGLFLLLWAAGMAFRHLRR